MVVLEVRSVAAAVGDVDPAATAYAHRTHEVFGSAWGAQGMDDALDAAWSAVTPQLRGMYAACSSDTRPELARVAYPGATYDRLAEIKRRYDPDNVFHRGITVDPASGETAPVGPGVRATG
ncbi:MAG: BBE domain-containing protein [Jiangellaceae bacterium]